MAVSPFDGSNRIRFKGSPNIADFRLLIADWIPSYSAIGNWQSPMPRLSAATFWRSGSPETYLIFKLSKWF